MSNFHYCNSTVGCACGGTAYPQQGYNSTSNELAYNSNSLQVYPQQLPYNAQVHSSDGISPISHPIRSIGASTTYRMPSHQTQGAPQSLLLSPEGSQAPSPPTRFSPDYQHGQYPGTEAVAQRPRRQAASSSRATPPYQAHPYPMPQLRLRPNPQVSDEDEDTLPELPPNATERQRIDYQRHRNTLAARRSRKRKELYRQELEQMVDQLTVETEKWRARAEMLRRIAESQGVDLNCPEWSD